MSRAISAVPALVVGVVVLSFGSAAGQTSSGPVTIQNPWIVNDRVADCRNVQTMGATFKNAYSPDGVAPPADEQAIAINVYNNHKRRVYHWANIPPTGPNNHPLEDPVYSVNVFGWGLCYLLGPQAATISNAAGIGARKIGLPGHVVYEVNYWGRWHLLDTMTTMYVSDRGSPAQIASCADIKADHSLMSAAVAENRACPGFLLCGDTVPGYLSMVDGWAAQGGGIVTTNWSMNMDLHAGETFTRTWEHWPNQHPTPVNPIDPPYHHDASRDWKDTVNFPYWEPYKVMMPVYWGGTMPTYRRWANGTYEMRPGFRTNTHSNMLYSSTNIATYADDHLNPDLHPASVGTPAEAVIKIKIPFYLTDASISGSFLRAGAADTLMIQVSPNGSSWTTVWTATDLGTTTLTNLGLRSQVFGKWEYYVKIVMVAGAAKSDVGVSNLVLSTTFEHNKGAMAYLDKGVNNLTFQFDNPQALAAGGRIRLTYKWKEFDGTDWTINGISQQIITTSPHAFTITVGGTKVPRTESVTIEVVPPPVPGDITGDGKVNVFDLQALAASWNKQQGQAGYDAACDLTGDNRVNVYDLQVLARNWGV